MIAERLAAQQLSGPPATTPEAVVQRLLAVQGQDPRGARLSIRARSVGLSAADVDDALTGRRSLLITWLNRGTLHLVTPEDYWWLHPLTTPQLATANTRRLGQEGVSTAQTERGVEVVVEEVTSHGPRTRGELREALDAAGVPTQGQALVHLLLAASLRGHVVRGPMRDGHHCFAAVAGWLGQGPAALDRDEALGRLARRYLAGHGPADARDLARWAGIPLGEARRGMAAIREETVQRGDALTDLVDRPPMAPVPPPRLLGAFDPVLLGWASREPLVGRHQGIVTTNGLFRPCALVEGRTVATWGLDAGAVTIRPLERIPAAQTAALQEDAKAVLSFLGMPERAAIASDRA